MEPVTTVQVTAVQQETQRRRRIRRNALLLTAFALAVYFGFIAAFVHSRS